MSGEPAPGRPYIGLLQRQKGRGAAGVLRAHMHEQGYGATAVLRVHMHEQGRGAAGVLRARTHA